MKDLSNGRESRGMFSVASIMMKGALRALNALELHKLVGRRRVVIGSGRSEFELTKISRVERENAVRIQSFPDIMKFSPGRDFSFTGKPNQIRVNRLLDNMPLVIYRLLKDFRRQFSIRKWTGLNPGEQSSESVLLVLSIVGRKGVNFVRQRRGISRISNL